MNTFDHWVSLSENIGKPGTERGIILQDEEYPGLARVSLEKTYSDHLKKDIFPVTMGIYGVLVHTAFFATREDALECIFSVKLVIQAMENKQQSLQ